MSESLSQARLLHPESMGYLGDQQLRSDLLARATEVATAPRPESDPPLTVLVRTHNDAVHLPALFRDILDQDYTGSVQTLVLDGFSDYNGVVAEFHTKTLDKQSETLSARVVSIPKLHYSAARALNTGFQQADHELVVSLVGHTELATNQFFRAAVSSLARSDINISAAYGVSLPGSNSTATERLGARVLGARKRVATGIQVLAKGTAEMGLLAADCTVIKRSAWVWRGGFDEQYGAGGADGDFAKRLLASKANIVSDPAGLAIHHGHALGAIASARQLAFWQSLGKPRPFNGGRGYDYCFDPKAKKRQ